ncbi:16954_t:CDS:1, partial [Entrophospora sp. SA101]
MQEQCAFITLLDSVQNNDEGPILTNSTVIDENSVLINPDVPAEHSMLINPTVNDTQYFIDPSLLTKSQEEQQLEQSAEQLEQPEQSEQ